MSGGHGGLLANFQVGVAQNLTHGDEKNSRRFAEIQEQILTCQEGLGHLVEGQREINYISTDRVAS